MAEPIQSVDRALAILDLMAERGAVTLNQVADFLSVSRPTAFRMLATLQHRYYVTHRTSEHLYRLGPVFSRLGARWVDETLTHEARKLMVNLSEHTGETVNLAVMRNMTLHYSLSVEASRTLRVSSPDGSAAPYNSTALGKAVLSELDRGMWSARLGTEPYPASTPNSIVSRDVLESDIAEAVSQGYATDREESVLGVSCVAAAFLGPDGQPLGAISVEAPTSRATAQALARNGAVVALAALELTARLRGDNVSGDGDRIDANDI